MSQGWLLCVCFGFNLVKKVKLNLTSFSSLKEFINGLLYRMKGLRKMSVTLKK